MSDFDSLVVGAGVVGLAVARQLLLRGRSTLVLEAAGRYGEGISARNSGVIHAGIYYPRGSLKARLCVRGRELLYQYCQERGVGYRKLGKLVVAVSETELAALATLAASAEGNGVIGSRRLSAAEAKGLEPALHCQGALWLSETGIVDVPELTMALVAEIEALGGTLLCNTEVVRANHTGTGFAVETATGDQVQVASLINAAGFGAIPLARQITGMPPAALPVPRFASGHYYALSGRAPFERLIYPLPQAAGLGVHLGLDLAGRARFGPDVRWIDAPDYRFDDRRRDDFVAAIQSWWPDLDPGRLSPDFVGVRPKLQAPGEPTQDFLIREESAFGLPGLVNLFGIESPGLTSALAIAEHCAELLDAS